VSRHAAGNRPDDQPGERSPGTELARVSDVTPRKPRRKRVVLNDSRNPVTVVRTITELEEQTSIGEALVRNLVRAQLRVAVGLALLAAVPLLGLPVAFFVFPAFAGTTVFGVRLPWLLVGVLPFPLLFAVGYWYNRSAERHERDFVNMVES
jgi:fatty acid desaturase